MAVNLIQSEYDTLEQLAHRFDIKAADTERLLGQVQRCLEQLQRGGWQGEGAQAFFREMDGEIGPAVTRLMLALRAGDETTRCIIAILQEAEEEAAGHFGDRGDARLGEPTIPVPPYHKPKDFDFNPDKIIGYEPDWANSKALNKAMSDLSHYLSEHPRLAKSEDGYYPMPPELYRHLDALAKARGVDRETIYQEYAKFIQHIDKSGGEMPQPALSYRDSYYGSTQHIRFGKVVGDHLDIDPVFGALLSPTGGTIGPGNSSLTPREFAILTILDPNHTFDPRAMAYHGVFHDAAGYLFNEHGIGAKGYQYSPYDAGLDQFIPGLESWEHGRGSGDALTGQLSGYLYWDHRLKMQDAAVVGNAVEGTTRIILRGARETYIVGKEVVGDIGDRLGF